jgi:osmoprotectant transport system permease protein
VNNFGAAIAWIFTPANFFGSSGQPGIPDRLGEHLLYSLVTLVIAVAIALPIGLAVGHTGKGRTAAILASSALRSLPTLGFLTLLALWAGLGFAPPLIVMVILALPPILAGGYAALEAIDPATIDSARAMGMSEWQILTKVEIPLGMPLILGGIRSASIQVIATWTVGAFLPLGGLGRYLIDGLAVANYAEMLAGSILVVALVLVVDGLFALAQRFVVPRGVLAGRVSEVRVKTTRATVAVR